MEKFFVPILLGTGRSGRESEKAAKYVFEVVKNYKPDQITTELIDVKDFVKSPYTIAYWEKTELTKKWAEIVAKSSGLIIVTPEYNHGYPGELKIMLDYAYEEYWGKPVAICGVSNGQLGGSRAVENLLAVLNGLKMMPVAEHVYFKNIENLFVEDGKIKDENYEKYIQKMVDSLTNLICVK